MHFLFISVSPRPMSTQSQPPSENNRATQWDASFDQGSQLDHHQPANTDLTDATSTSQEDAKQPYNKQCRQSGLDFPP
jgi:hypothetical protein